MRAKLAGASFGDAGRTVVIEEGMTGPEVSVFAICDGTRAVALGPGAGLQAGRRRRHRARTPAAWAPTARCRGSAEDFADDVIARFVQPTLDELRRRGIDYRGVLYTGLMVTPGGAEAGRVQRPLRRPGQPGRAPAAHLRPGQPCSRRPPPASSRHRADLRRRRRRARRRGRRGLPGRRAHRRRDRGPRRRPAGRRGRPCSAPVSPTAATGSS